MIPNVSCHPTRFARKVPAGTPIDRATGAPAIAIAMALPRCPGATMRRAYPASSAHSRPATTPATNRAAIVSA